jgi:hypothetical protein
MDRSRSIATLANVSTEPSSALRLARRSAGLAVTREKATEALSAVHFKRQKHVVRRVSESPTSTPRTAPALGNDMRILSAPASSNGLDLSCPAAQATLHPFPHNSAGKTRSRFPHASRVSCSELLGIRHGRPWKTRRETE